jgi:hypothetical protein
VHCTRYWTSPTGDREALREALLSQLDRLRDRRDKQLEPLAAAGVIYDT